MSNRAFGNADFIDASRQFVCVRPDSYESKANQDKIRVLLNGRMENTAFVLLSPDGTKWLSNSGRGLTPDVSGSRGLDRVALQYQPKGESSDALVPDFNSFRMALNIASADSRVLVTIVAPNGKMSEVEKKMRSVAWDDAVVGRFHFDRESDKDQIAKPIGLSSKKMDWGIYVIRPGEFGVDGSVMAQLPLDAPNTEVIAALRKANSEYAKTTARKTYSAHVKKGRQEGYYFEMQMEFGEDRDGDGAIDDHSKRLTAGSKQRAERSGKYFRPPTKEAKAVKAADRK